MVNRRFPPRLDRSVRWTFMRIRQCFEVIVGIRHGRLDRRQPFQRPLCKTLMDLCLSLCRVESDTSREPPCQCSPQAPTRRAETSSSEGMVHCASVHINGIDGKDDRKDCPVCQALKRTLGVAIDLFDRLSRREQIWYRQPGSSHNLSSKRSR